MLSALLEHLAEAAAPAVVFLADRGEAVLRSRAGAARVARSTASCTVAVTSHCSPSSHSKPSSPMSANSSPSQSAETDAEMTFVSAATVDHAALVGGVASPSAAPPPPPPPPGAFSAPSAGSEKLMSTRVVASVASSGSRMRTL